MEDIMLSRIPAWGVEGVTTCIFHKLVALGWPSIMCGPIGNAETTCLRVKNIRGKGKGCAWPTEGIRQSFGSLENLSLGVHAFTRSAFYGEFVKIDHGVRTAITTSH
jgi:hypothetical protein